MGKPYAEDLRLVVVRPVSSVGRYIRRYRATGSVSPDQFGGYKDYALAG